MGKEMNQELYNAVFSEEIDLHRVEIVLSAGADPLGPLLESNDECVLGELFCESSIRDDIYDNGINPVRNKLPELVKLFIEHGMKPTSIPAEHHDDENENIPMWYLAFCCSREGAEALKMLLDNALNTEALDDFISHFYIDCEMTGGSDIDDAYLNYLTYGLKMVMLSASYPEVLEKSKYLSSCIGVAEENSGNVYDLTRFRDYEEYDYSIDISTCDNIPYGLRNATVEICEKGSNVIIWKMYL